MAKGLSSQRLPIRRRGREALQSRGLLPHKASLFFRRKAPCLLLQTSATTHTGLDAALLARRVPGAPVQGERSLCSRCRGPRGHLPTLTPASSQSLEGFKAPRKSRSRRPPGRLDSPRTLEDESWFCLRQQFSNLLVSRLLKIGLPTWYGGKESACNAGDCPKCRRLGFDPWVRKILWRRKWQPTPVFLPGKSHGQRSLGGYSPRGRRVRRDWATKQQAFVYVLYQLILPH